MSPAARPSGSRVHWRRHGGVAGWCAQCRRLLLQGRRPSCSNCAAVRSASCLRCQAFLGRRLLHFLAVLVHPGDEENIITVKLLESRDRVRRDPLIGVPDMRCAIGVRDRGRNIECGTVTHELAISKLRVAAENGPAPVLFRIGKLAWPPPNRRKGRERAAACRD